VSPAQAQANAKKALHTNLRLNGTFVPMTNSNFNNNPEQSSNMQTTPQNNTRKNSKNGQLLTASQYKTRRRRDNRKKAKAKAALATQALGQQNQQAVSAQ